MTEAVQPIEGITPTMLWNFVLVLLGICAVVILVYKVIEIIRKEHERKEKKTQLHSGDLTDEIADKVMEKLEPRLKKIDAKLSSDKERLDSHERRLNTYETSLSLVGGDTEMLLDAMDGIYMHFITGNDVEHLKKIKMDLDHYKNTRVNRIVKNGI